MSNTASTYGFTSKASAAVVGNKVSSRANLVPNGPGYDAGGNDQLTSARRRHNAVTRRTYARESGLLNLKEMDSKAFDYSEDDLKVTAQAMFDQYKVGRITRGQIEAEQRADKDRLTGWLVYPPQEGTQGAEMVKRLQYRMAVRARVLDQILKYELPYLVGTTGRSALDQEVSTSPPNKAWRAGAGMVK